MIIKINLMKQNMHINLKQIQTLRSINEHGSFSNAARILNLTPPAITVQIRSLERALGAKVLIRSPKGANKLTHVGQEIVDLSNRIDNNIKNAQNRIISIKNGQLGSVTLGVVSTGKYFAPWIVANAKAKFHELDIELFVGNRNEIINALDQDKIDLAIMGRPPRSNFITAEVLGDHPHVMIAPPTHHLLKQLKSKYPSDRQKTGDILANEIIITRETGSGTRILLDRFLNQFSSDNVFRKKEMSSNETVKQSVMAGLGVALISKSTITAELNDGRLKCIDLPGLPIVRQWFLVHAKQEELNPATQTLRRFLMDKEQNILSAALKSILV